MNNDLNKTMETFRTLLKPLRLYHRYNVEGLSSFPKTGPVILAVHHSLATYDGFLLGLEIYEKKNRLPRGLGDDLLFKLPFTKEWAPDIGIVPASHENAKQLLENGELLAIAPGGMRESLRPSDERYKVRWNKRKGFARLAIETGTPIVLAACPSADRIFKIYENPITAFAYKKFRFPLPIFRGWGLSMMPRPVKLTHYLSKPIIPPKLDSENFDIQVNTFHAHLLNEMDNLMSRER
ncbi:MAG: acyltransferase family protein [Bacteriovoracaceae bacterium]|nr:acyltransferase family protein [Bacteriovoracaceae bacterium]